MKSSQMDRLWSVVVCLALGVAAIGPAGASPALAQTAADDDAQPTLESQFANYLHFALIGLFDVADQKYGEPLLNRPELDPLTQDAAVELIRLSEKYPDSMDTLLLLINNSTIGDNAERILDKLREAHRMKRQDPARIRENIKLLAGGPMQRQVGLERLIDSGEYAVPWMLGVIADPQADEIRPFVTKALPELGKDAVNPLLAALNMKDEATVGVVIRTLGKIGYPQALPYLQRLADSQDRSKQIREAAELAIDDIVVENAGVKKGSASELFNRLAEQYYDNLDSLRPDPRQDLANLWQVRANALPGEDQLSPTPIPSEIYPLVMTMKCCEASLALSADQPMTVALWLAANFRREGRLGLDVASEETVDARALDPSRPEAFPRSIYFARMAGPVCCQIALARGIKEARREITLGAVTALTSTAGRRALVEAADDHGISLGQALYFPDLLVRIKAALALGRAMPQEVFPASTEVVPVLTSVLSPNEKRYYMLIDPTDETADAIEAQLSNNGGVVLRADALNVALSRAHKELTHLDAVLLASDMQQPSLLDAIKTLAADHRFALAPIVVLSRGQDEMRLGRVKSLDPRIAHVVLPAEAREIDSGWMEQLMAKRDDVAAAFGYGDLSPEVRLSLAMQSAAVLKTIASSMTTVYDASLAEDALVGTLQSHPSRELRLAAGEVLAWLDSSPSQQALAAVALADAEDESLRLEMFDLLADSARRFGSRLSDDQAERLLAQSVGEPNLTLRTAASQAMGAMDLPLANVVSVIVPTGQ